MSIPYILFKKPKYPFEFWVDISIFNSIVKYFKEEPCKILWNAPPFTEICKNDVIDLRFLNLFVKL